MFITSKRPTLSVCSILVTVCLYIATATPTVAQPDNNPPIAQAFISQPQHPALINPNDLVQLDGSGSFDPDEATPEGAVLEYKWDLMAFPPGSSVPSPTCDNATCDIASFVPDVAGDYALKLTVTDVHDESGEIEVPFTALVPSAQDPEPCACYGDPGDVIELGLFVSDAGGNGVGGWKVIFNVEQGDGELIPPTMEGQGARRMQATVGAQAALMMDVLRPPNHQGFALVDSVRFQKPGTVVPDNYDDVPNEPDERRRITVLTDAEGRARVFYRIGKEQRQVVTALGRGVDDDPGLFIISRSTNGCYQHLPAPELEVTGTENYTAGERQWTRFKLAVKNYLAYPDALFAPAPHLPPCGLNNNASRGWVDIFEGSSTRLYGFCALSSPADLNALWFSIPQGSLPPDSVSIKIIDRQCERTYAAEPIKLWPKITSPEPDSLLPGCAVTFRWDAIGAAVTEWWLSIGSQPGWADVFNSGRLGTRLAVPVEGLPRDGRQLFVRLWFRRDGLWQFIDAEYSAAYD